MAYTPDTLSLIHNGVGDYTQRIWLYQTASDSDATIVGASYFATGATFGMKVGDLVDVVATTGPKYKRYQVASTIGAAVTVAAPTAIT